MRPRRSIPPILLAALLFSLVPLSASAAGGEEWTQYRHSETNNAVIAPGLAEIYTGHVETKNEVRATPTIADGMMLVGNHDSGDLQAYDLASGEQLWHTAAPNWVHSELLYSEGIVVVGFGNRFFTGDIRGTGESGVLGLDARTGAELWRVDTEGSVMPTPAIARGTVHVVTGDRHYYALELTTGEELSRTDTGHVVSMSSPALVGEMLYFGGGRLLPYAFTALDTRSGEVAWQAEFPDVVNGMDDVPPAVSDGIVVTTANRAGPGSHPDDPVNKHVLFALEADTGEILWEAELGVGPRPSNNQSGAPTIHDGAVFLGSPTTGQSYGYDLATGARFWQVDTGAVKGAPAVKDAVVYIGTTDGLIYALQADTGEQLGARDLGGVLAPSGPVIVDDTLIVGSQDANVYLTPVDDILGHELGGAFGLVGAALAGVVIVIVAAVAGVLVRAKPSRRGASASG